MDVLAIILFFWARWLSKQAGVPRWLRFVPPALVVVFFVALGGTLFALVGAFAAVDHLAPADKATFLAVAIGEAMNFTAFGIIFDGLALVVLVVMTVRHKSRKR